MHWGMYSLFTTPLGVSSRGRARTALAELQRRYAMGEMSTEQYEERKARLLRDRTV